MNKLRIIEELCNGNFIVEYTIDDVQWNKEVSKRELRADILGKAYQIYAETPVSIYTVELDDNYDNDMDVNLNKLTYYEYDCDYDCVKTKTYKRRSDAERYYINLQLKTTDM